MFKNQTTKIDFLKSITGQYGESYVYDFTIFGLLQTVSERSIFYNSEVDQFQLFVKDISIKEEVLIFTKRINDKLLINSLEYTIIDRKIFKRGIKTSFSFVVSKPL